MKQTNKLKLMGKNHSDELYTPESAIEILLPYLKKNWVIWECTFGTGKLAKHFEKKGFDVIGYKDEIFEEVDIKDFDCIVTNPPFSKKIKFIETCYKWKKPFALLLPLTALDGIKIQSMFKENGIQILFPRGRIDFNGKKAPWFYTCWFTWGLNLPKELNFIELNLKEAPSIPPNPKGIGYP